MQYVTSGGPTFTSVPGTKKADVPVPPVARLAGSTGMRHNFADAMPECSFRGGVVQRVLRSQAATYNTVADLNLPPADVASAVVVRLLAAPETHYLPQPLPDFQAATIRTLERKKYLLGEHHGDGTWATRTALWPYVETMRESVKGLDGQGADENAVIAASGVVPVGQGLPLEDYHAYAMTQLTVVRQMLKGYSNIKLLAVDPMVRGELTEITRILTQYGDVGTRLMARIGVQAPGTRPHYLMEVGLGSAGLPGWRVLQGVTSGAIAWNAMSDEEVRDLKDLVQAGVTNLIELIDTRPKSGGLWGALGYREGADPVPNRATITGLAAGGGGAWATGMASAVTQGNIVREAAMIRRITAAPAPLVVQVGDAHVPTLATAIGADGVAIRQGADFVAPTTRN
jgi:hypothetical protein